VLAGTAGQTHLPIEIFPACLTDHELDQLASEQRAEPQIVEFWENLKEGFDHFEKYHSPPTVRISRGGKYVFSRE
jgi:murein L,D-transpeptidase YafK